MRKKWRFRWSPQCGATRCITVAQLTLLAWILTFDPGVAQEGMAPAPRSYAFEGVTVIPMEGAVRSLPRQTVVVADGRITAVGAAGTVAIPSGVTRIDGTGRYLIPGLADMRVRLFGQDDPNRALLEDEFLFLHIAHGITTVRASDGALYQLAVGDAIERGEILGPTLYVGSPSLAPLAQRANERAAVGAYASAGFDFITIDAELSVDAWNRAVEAATATGISFAGRPPAGVSVERAIDAGISTLDRLDGFLEVTRRADLPASAPLEQVYRATDMDKLRALARRTAEAGVFVIPAQYLANHHAGWNHVAGRVQGDSVVHLPEYGYTSQDQGHAWIREAWSRANAPGVSEESGRAYAEWRGTLVRALHEAGVPILMGTESPALLNIPALSLHREIELMAQAGLTPYEILETGTRNVARYVEEVLGMPGDFGAVVQGNRADLVLLDENPLESVTALQSRVGVMVRGRWVPQSEMDPRLKRILIRYVPEEPD